MTVIGALCGGLILIGLLSRAVAAGLKGTFRLRRRARNLLGTSIAVAGSTAIVLVTGSPDLMPAYLIAGLIIGVVDLVRGNEAVPDAPDEDEPEPKKRRKVRGGSPPATRTCADCGARNDEDARFCKRCGSPTGPPTCSACATLNDADAQFCKRCGERVETRIRPATDPRL